jgi:hypothetical protein
MAIAPLGSAVRMSSDCQNQKYEAISEGFMAVDAGSGEPVSEARFPANREKNREFYENRAVWQKAARQNVAKSDC